MATLIIPWRETDDLWRLAALGAVRSLRLSEGYQTLIANEQDPAQPWVKARPFWQALQGRDPDEVVAMHDADVWCSHYHLEEAIAAVADGEVEWALPHGRVYRLTPVSTRRLLNGASLDQPQLEQPSYDGIPGGGIVVARVGTLLDTPLDALFVGWARRTSAGAWRSPPCTAKPYRGDAILIHLWHEPQERQTRTRGSLDNWLRKACYGEAAGDPERMRRLVDGGKRNLEVAEAPVHDHA